MAYEQLARVGRRRHDCTTFGFTEALGIDVPLEMRDRYPFQR